MDGIVQLNQGRWNHAEVEDALKNNHALEWVSLSFDKPLEWRERSTSKHINIAPSTSFSLRNPFHFNPTTIHKDWKNQRLGMVYFVNASLREKHVTWLLMTAQLKNLWSAKIFQTLAHADLHLVMVCPETEVEFWKDKVRNLFLYDLHMILDDFQKRVLFTFSFENRHEYDGIFKVWELAQLEEKLLSVTSKRPKHPSVPANLEVSSVKDQQDDNHTNAPRYKYDILLYFHSKSITRFRAKHNYRDPIEQSCFKLVVENWRQALFVFYHFLSIDKVGPSCSEQGWMWHNFFYARSSYLRNVERPTITPNRYYYEDWLCRRYQDSISPQERRLTELHILTTQGDHASYDDPKYDKSYTNCYNLLMKNHPSRRTFHIGSFHPPENSLHGTQTF